MRIAVQTQNIVEIIRDGVKGTSTMTVDLDSPMDGKGKMKKTGNPYVGMGVVKRVTLNGMVGYNYSNSVNTVAIREDKEVRETKRHPWGDMDDKRCFRVHRGNGNAYLTMKVETSNIHGFFLPNGTEIPVESIKPFIPVKKKSSTQADLDKEIIARDFDIRNITAIRAFQNEYVIADEIMDVERDEAQEDVAQEDVAQEDVAQEDVAHPVKAE